MIGRLPAATPEEMSAMVAKIIRFEREGAAADRGMGCIIGNPLPGREHIKAVDLLLALQIRSTLAAVNPEWRIGGAADLFWKPLPQARGDFASAIGALMAGSEREIITYSRQGQLQLGFMTVGQPSDQFKSEVAQAPFRVFPVARYAGC